MDLAWQAVPDIWGGEFIRAGASGEHLPFQPRRTAPF